MAKKKELTTDSLLLNSLSLRLNRIKFGDSSVHLLSFPGFFYAIQLQRLRLGNFLQASFYVLSMKLI